MRDPRNEREAQPHLQRQADAHYRRYEMHKVQPAYKGGRPWRHWAVFALLVFGLVAVVTFPFIFIVKGLT